MNHLRPFLLKHQARLDQVVGFFYAQMVIIDLIFLFPFFIFIFLLFYFLTVLALVGFFPFFSWGLGSKGQGSCVSELYVRRRNYTLDSCLVDEV